MNSDGLSSRAIEISADKVGVSIAEMGGALDIRDYKSIRLHRRYCDYTGPVPDPAFMILDTGGESCQ